MANVTLPGIKVCYALSSCLGNISEADMLLELELYLGLKLLNNELTEDQIVDLVKGKTLYEVYDLVTT
jgi:hypothetical protein